MPHEYYYDIETAMMPKIFDERELGEYQSDQISRIRGPFRSFTAAKLEVLRVLRMDADEIRDSIRQVKLMRAPRFPDALPLEIPNSFKMIPDGSGKMAVKR